MFSIKVFRYAPQKNASESPQGRFSSKMFLNFEHRFITMKRLLLIALTILALVGCEKLGDTTLNGKKFEYNNGETGTWQIKESFEFQKSGNVYHTSKVGLTSEFNTDGCALYYTLDGENLTIYYGLKGWKKEVRNTVYRSGTYLGSYLIIDDKQFNLK